MPENKPDQPVASHTEGRRRKAFKKEKASEVKLDLSGVKVEEVKEVKKKDAKPGLVDKYLAVVKTRRPSLPVGVFETIGKAGTKGEAKRALKDYLVSKGIA